MRSEFNLATQRWIVAKAIQDLKPRTIEEIEELVGFNPEECLLDELRGAKNFSRRGNKWQLKPKALEVMEHDENTPVQPFKRRR